MTGGQRASDKYKVVNGRKTMNNEKTSAATVLAAIEITKGFSFPDKTIPVLSRVSINIPRGDWITIIGPSGGGKTTLVKILAGILTPDSGKITIDAEGQDPCRVIAYMPQNDSLLPWRTSLGNAILASQIEGRSRKEAQSEARELFGRFGLAGFENLYPSELSGGMRQRLALIRTFLSHREVLLLDEPLGSLDPLTRTTMQEWLLLVWQQLGKSILLVTHDVDEAIFLSDLIYLFSRRPAHVRRQFNIELPRPRARAAQSLIELKAKILDLIHTETLNG